MKQENFWRRLSEAIQTRDLKRVGSRRMSQWKENKVTEGIIFSVIPLFHRDFHGTWMVLIKTRRPEDSGGGSGGRTVLSLARRNGRFTYVCIPFSSIERLLEEFTFIFWLLFTHQSRPSVSFLMHSFNQPFFKSVLEIKKMHLKWVKILKLLSKI